jgi:hypothetical protein
MRTFPGSSLALVAGLCLASGCAGVRGLRPIYPAVDETVNTLRPTLRWEPTTEQDATYDLAIVQQTSEDTFHKEGEAYAYYVQGLAAPEHQLSRPLEPGVVYLWSIRVRRGKDVTDWSRYAQKKTYVLWTTTTFQPFWFRTSPVAAP